MIKSSLILFFLLGAFLGLSAGEIVMIDEPERVRLFNKSSGKILTYYLVPAGDEIEAALVGIDTLKVYSRILSVQSKDYHYRISIDGLSRDVTRTSRPSKTTSGLAGEEVSAYNSYVKAVTRPRARIVLQNISEHEILIKLRGNNQNQGAEDIEYVRYSPDSYQEERILILNNREYTYFAADGQGISFDLEGPVLLKIVSRLLFPDNLTAKFNYRFQVKIDGEELTIFNETAYPSVRSVLRDTGKIISSGDVNIIRIPAGIHTVAIEDPDINRELIFRFYINKSAVELTQ